MLFSDPDLWSENSSHLADSCENVREAGGGASWEETWDDVMMERLSAEDGGGDSEKRNTTTTRKAVPVYIAWLSAVASLIN